MKKLLIAFTLACIIFIPIGGYAMIATLSLDNLVINSDSVVTVTLKTKTEGGKDAKGFANLANTLTVLESLKGNIKPGTDIVIETISGFEDSPVFEPRMQFLVFLQKIETATSTKEVAGHFKVTNFVQGCWPIDHSGKLLGMGTGTTRAQVEAKIVETRGKKPAPSAPTTPPAPGM
ncbi:MAG: hypothetical protein HQM09_15980 [Candidatus Riflebacteria bacterium]|nr:hypothetical protein [Candidatus Riflebacteria bacterium]